MPTLAEVQNQFCANLRDPENSQPLSGVELDRMQVYQELIYNNVEDALSTVFPICQQIVGAKRWHKLVRQFFIDYPASKPLYRHISEEFLQFLLSLPIDTQYPFLQELAHFEWIELALDNDPQSFETLKMKAAPDISNDIIQLSPLAWNLVYQYPVHDIEEDYQPNSVSKSNTFIIAYRNRDDELNFDVTDHFTHLILDACKENNALTSIELLAELAKKHQQDEQAVRELGLEVLQNLAEQDIIYSLQE